MQLKTTLGVARRVEHSPFTRLVVRDGPVADPSAPRAIGRTTWKESVYDKEAERNEQTTANHQSSARERRALPQKEEL